MLVWQVLSVQPAYLTLATPIRTLKTKPFTFSLKVAMELNRMAATTAEPLDSLAQQIARQQAELQGLQQEYQSRQARLAELTQQKQDLKSQLRQIEATIQATKQGQVIGAPSVPIADLPRAGAGAAHLPRAHTLPALLLEIVGKAGGPVTVKKLAREVRRRKFPTKSTNLSTMVDVRVRELVRNGLLRRAQGQPGVVPAASVPGMASGSRPTFPTVSRSRNGDGAVKTAHAKTRGKRQGPSLRERLTNLLAKRKRPMPARELAEQVLAAGYKTKSKNFMEVMWVALSQMNNVRNVPGKGYVLKA